MMKKEFLIKAFALMACLMCSTGAMAQEAYANFTPSDSTLTFYFDTQRSSRPGTTYSLNTGESYPDWSYYSSIVYHLAFDPSFAAARPTTTSSWFRGMDKLTTITGIHYLNTSLVTDMEHMFHGCTLLRSIDLSAFDTRNVADMNSMFVGCKSLISLDLSALDTRNVTDMNCMFAGCTTLTSLDLSTLDTGNVTDMNGMFGACTALTSIDLSPLNTGNVTNMSRLFYECRSLTSVNLSGINTGNVTDMNSMFTRCSSLLSMDLSGLNTGNVINMAEMFLGCSTLTSVNMSGLNTSNVINMRGMFMECTSLTTIDLSTIDTGKVTNMASMFMGCKALTSFDWRNFKPGGLTNIAYMFHGCSALASANLSGLNTGNVTNMAYMFYGCSALASIALTGINTESVADMSNMFSYCTSLASLDLSGWSNSNLIQMAGMFSDCRALTTLDLSEFGTENVVNMAGAFYGCSSLKSLDLSGLNTQNVVYMTSMIRDCRALTTLDLSGFNTKSAKFMAHMFSGCNNLSTIYAGNEWSTDSVTQSSEMFYGCTHLIGGQGTTYDESQVDAARAHIDGGPINPGYLSIKNGPAPSIAYALLSTDGATLTFYCDSLRSSRQGTTYLLNTSGPNPGWADAAMGITHVVFDSTCVDARPTSTRNWFSQMNRLDSITGITYLNTSFVTDMRKMFAGCTSLTTLDVSGFSTENVTNMWAMFDGCESLTALDVRGFNTSRVTNMARMFSGCRSLAALDVSSMSTASATDLAGIFAGCESLTSLDVSSFSTGSVKYMGWMFSGCKSLTSLDMGNLSTAKVTEMEYMFEGCESLTSLDLSGFSTANVRNMEAMFDGGSRLETIDASSAWRTDAVVESSNMFRGCTRLVGGMGTTHDENHVDATRARIDGGPDQPGYFTGKAARLRGDVNADGEVNIADVNCIISAIQGDVDTYEGRADVNNDGEVTVADINAIIEIILGDYTPTPGQSEHKYVDLGLPSGTLWATCNIGASRPEDNGDYFSWGETVPKDYYSWSTYKWCNGLSTMTKYNNESGFGTVDSKIQLDAEDDAAYVNWGPQWRMPTQEQQQELIDQCTWTQKTQNGVVGHLVTGPNGNTIFLPAAGFRIDETTPSLNGNGNYWSRTLSQSSSSKAYSLSTITHSYSNPALCSSIDRLAGHTVRAVRVP